ncbi:MAG: DUF368 domain-containing protein [SAR86 cluster bacterium]|nr:DUF368 domain-containing protein [SAR86 cluster bacterium]
MKSFLILIKGFFIGVAEIIPGVSGGTIALLFGIYEHLINMISKFNISFFKFLAKREFKDAWTYIDGKFISILLIGMLLGIFSFSALIVFLLSNYPYFLKSIFSSLLFCSLFLYPIKPKIITKKFGAGFLISLLIVIFVFLLPTLDQENISFIVIFFGGFIAICGFILPGVSGSFILLILGLYGFMINALVNLDYLILLIFLCGCLFGLFTFVRLLRKAYKFQKPILEGIFFGLVLLSIPLIWKVEIKFFFDIVSSNFFEIFLGLSIGVVLIFSLHKVRKV